MFGLWVMHLGGTSKDVVRSTPLPRRGGSAVFARIAAAAGGSGHGSGPSRLGSIDGSRGSAAVGAAAVCACAHASIG